MVLLTSLAIGAITGVCFRVLVLLVPIGVAVVIAASTGLMHGHAFVGTLGEMIATVLALQVGYLLGVLGRGPLSPLIRSAAALDDPSLAGAPADAIAMKVAHGSDTFSQR